MSAPNLESTPKKSDPTQDALHVPVVKLVACRDLLPGCRIKVEPLSYYEDHQRAVEADDCDYHAIVSPFLDDPVKEGSLFWAIVRPGSVSKLSHTWYHDKIASAQEIDEFNRDDDDGCRGCY